MLSAIAAPWAWLLPALSFGTITRAPSPPVVPSTQQQELVLTGTWKFNAEKTASDRRSQAAEPRTREGYASGGRPRVGTGITEPRGGGGNRGGAGGSADLGPLTPYTRALPQLVFAQTDSTITTSDPALQQRTYWIDGRKETVSLPGMEPIEYSAKWKGGKLTIERKFGGGGGGGAAGTVREVYVVKSGGSELTVEVRLTAPGLAEPMNQIRIYDLVPPKP